MDSFYFDFHHYWCEAWSDSWSFGCDLLFSLETSFLRPRCFEISPQYTIVCGSVFIHYYGPLWPLWSGNWIVWEILSLIFSILVSSIWDLLLLSVGLPSWFSSILPPPHLSFLSLSSTFLEIFLILSSFAFLTSKILFFCFLDVPFYSICLFLFCFLKFSSP